MSTASIHKPEGLRSQARRALVSRTITLAAISRATHITIARLGHLIWSDSSGLSEQELLSILALLPAQRAEVVRNGQIRNGGNPRPIEERFWTKVDKRGGDECWPWLAALDDKGYGRIKYKKQMWLASRISILIHCGDPGKALVLHSCDNPICVKPKHLTVGTQKENMRDCVARGRHQSQRAA